jgi:hypothetical protein
MHTKLRTVGRLAAASGAAALIGCNALSTSELSPPHVRRASCTTQHVAASAEEKLSPEYQTWWQEVKHFCRDTKEEFAAEYHKNDVWPYPYNELAQHAATEPFAIQAENARLQMVSMWDHHFQTESAELSTMGRQRLKTIVEQSGTLGHKVYVTRCDDPEQTKLRIAEIQTELKRLTDDGAEFEVIEGRATPSTMSGPEAQRAVKLLTETKATGNLPGSGGSTTGGSTGGGSGGQQ